MPLGGSRQELKVGQQSADRGHVASWWGCDRSSPTPPFVRVNCDIAIGPYRADFSTFTCRGLGQRCWW